MAKNTRLPPELPPRHRRLKWWILAAVIAKPLGMSIRQAYEIIRVLDKRGGETDD